MKRFLTCLIVVTISFTLFSSSKDYCDQSFKPRKKEDVQSLQHFLNQSTRANLKVDGKFGPQTRDALKKYCVSLTALPTKPSSNEKSDSQIVGWIIQSTKNIIKWLVLAALWLIFFHPLISLLLIYGVMFLFELFKKKQPEEEETVYWGLGGGDCNSNSGDQNGAQGNPYS